MKYARHLKPALLLIAVLAAFAWSAHSVWAQSYPYPNNECNSGMFFGYGNGGTAQQYANDMNTNCGTVHCETTDTFWGSTVVCYSDPAPTYTACQSGSNSCGQTNWGISADGGACSAPTPGNPSYYGQGCSVTSSANACGQTNTNYGSYDCSANCSAGTPAAPYTNYGQSCTSAPNACGQTNSGSYSCDGSCSASTPSNASCNQPPNTPLFAYAYDNATGAYWGASAPDNRPSGYRIYIRATDPNGDNVALRYQLWRPTDGVYEENWANPVWNGSGSWATVDAFSNYGPGTYYVRAYSYDTSGVTSAWSDWQPITLYNSAPNVPVFSYLYTNDSVAYSGASGSAYYPAGYRVYMYGTDPDGDNVAIHYQLYNAQTGQTFADNWSENPVWNGSGSWTYTANFANFGPGTYYVRAYTYDTSGVTSAWSDWQGITLTTPAVAASCSASPTSIYEGQAVTWSVNNVSGGNGTYTYSWSGTDGLSGSASSVSKSYSTSGAKTASVVVSSAGLNTTVNCNADANPSDGTVTVTSCNPTLNASPSTVDLGQTTDLQWSVPAACASSCVFSDGHSAGRSGSYTVTPPLPSSGTTDIYAVTCPTGTSKVAQTTVTVRVPTATITATPNRVKSGDSSTIAWNATNVTSCSITKNGTAWKTGLAADVSGNVTGSAPDPVTTQITYKLSCVNGSGTVQAQAAAQSVVNVVPGFQEF